MLLTDDETGVAETCADRLAEFEIDVVVVKHRRSSEYIAGSFEADLCDPEQVEALLADVRSHFGRIGGIIHLLPFSKVTDISPAARAELEVKSLYLLTKATGEEMNEIVKAEKGFVFGATVLGGQLGFGDHRLDSLARAGDGGISGYLKCLGMEWPDVLVRSIDFSPDTDSKEIVACFERELSDPSGPFETGWRDGQRYTWEPISSGSGDLLSEPTLEIDSDSVIMITGGARGITAAIASAWGRKFQSRLILLGRSPLPHDRENGSTSGITGKAELKKAIMAEITTAGGKATPAEVERRYRKLMTEREMRENIAAIRATGAKVDYYSIDVRNHEQLSAVCDEIYTKYGKIDGLIHGAGIIDDKLVKDKTPESFNRVFSTKVDSSFAFAEILKPESLKFAAFFASIASRYGNQGQSDYAAANEVLCKLATDLDKQWDARVFAVAWGPWSEIGMVADLEKHLTARGISLIDRETGCRMFIDEVLYGKKGDSEVIIAGGAENLITPSTNQSVTVS